MYKASPLLLALLLPVPVLAQAGDDGRDAKIARLEQTVAELTRRLQALESGRGGQSPPPVEAAAAPAAPWREPPAAATGREPASLAVALPAESPLPDRPSMDEDADVAARADNVLPPGQEGLEGYFPIRGTSTWMRISGYAKLDAMFDSDDAGDPDLFVTSAIPVGAQDGRGAFNMHARQTRLTLDVRRPTAYGWLRFVLQNDFFGSGGSYGYRLRNAYGQLGNTYAGYGFSAFMDLDSTPDTLDFAGAGSMPSARLASVRRYFPLRGGHQLFVAAEHNPPELTGPAGSEARTTVPGLVFGYRHESERAHLQATGLLRHIAYDSATGSDGTSGGGLTVSGSLEAGGDGFLVYGALAGRGIAAYTGDLAGLGLDAVIDGDGSLALLDEWGGWVGYTHAWTPAWRSTLAWGRLYLEHSGLLDPSVFHRSDYVAANLVYSPLPSWSWGVEVLYGRLQLQDASSGDVFRLQTSLKYDFIK